MIQYLVNVSGGLSLPLCASNLHHIIVFARVEANISRATRCRSEPRARSRCSCFSVCSKDSALLKGYDTRSRTVRLVLVPFMVSPLSYLHWQSYVSSLSVAAPPIRKLDHLPVAPESYWRVGCTSGGLQSHPASRSELSKSQFYEGFDVLIN